MNRFNRWLPFQQPKTFGQGMVNGFVLANLWGVVPVFIIVLAVTR